MASPDRDSAMAGPPRHMSRGFLPWGFSFLLHAIVLLVLGWVIMAPVLPYVQGGVEVELVTLLPTDGGGGGQGLPGDGGEEPAQESLKSVTTQAPPVEKPSPPPVVSVEEKDRDPKELIASQPEPEVEEQETAPEEPPLLARAIPTLTLPINPLPSKTSGVPSSPPLVVEEGEEAQGGTTGQGITGDGRFGALPNPNEGRGSGGAGIGSGGMGDGSGRGIGWRQLLRQRIEGAKRYPVLARRLGMEGTVEVEFRIAQDGSVKGVKVAKSSGFPLLDQASVQAIKRAAPLPFVSGKIRVPLSYRLHKGR